MAVLFRNYEKYLIDPQDNEHFLESGKIFNSSSFLKKNASLNDNIWVFLSDVLSTRMFEQFIRERLDEPKISELKMFDETILQRKNISKKNKLKGGLKKTPFLSDQSDWVSYLRSLAQLSS